MFLNAFFSNIHLKDRSKVHDIVINWTESYNFQQFQKYSHFLSYHYYGYDIFATYVKHLQDVCKFFIWMLSTPYL
jgi:hypothetical protein